ncbi:CheR family methyltransferase [Altericista sp. CCNU0014]|uniref:CheR family methyltransferase n=1 Tax=Altericista sp. CCNU0014 TaxID=3082949 RepID=UPI00384DA472
MKINDDHRSFDELLDYLRQSRGFDFSGYKRASLTRRVQRQMQFHALENYKDYQDYLEVHPEAFSLLFNTILINVTAFFRDASAWNYLQTETIPHLLNEKPAQSRIRIWSAGCASGEEAYTLAMIFAHMLGIESFRQRVKIYATDVDEEALLHARQSIYSAREIKSVPQAFQTQFFEPAGDQYIFHPELRRSVIFGRHDLLQDAPISRLDLLVCRNTLMYFNAETQAKVLKRFHFALNSAGVLLLGKAEMLLTHTNSFIPISLQHRIFRRVSQKNRRDPLLAKVQIFEDPPSNALENYIYLRELAFESLPMAQIIVNFDGILVLANAAARSMFKLNLMDLGRPLQDLEISYRPLELRSHIDQVYRERHLVIINDVVRNFPDHCAQSLDVQFNPLADENDELLGVSITFVDVTHYHDLQEALQHSNQELETSNEELQSSNEELETTNEELQSTNEELETTNEELQSSNEKLETMNEELQSTNEELQTINAELQQRTDELNEANAFVSSIFASLSLGVIAIDRQFNILTWNPRVEDLWGLRAEEVKGQSLLGLEIGLPVEQLREPVLNCLKGNATRQELVLKARNRRGRDIQCHLSFSPLNGNEVLQRGVIILMEEVT